MSKIKHVLLVSLDDPNDPKSWSGTPFQVRKALEGQFEHVSVLTGIPTTRRPLQVAARIALGQDRYPLWMTGPSLERFARSLEATAHQIKPDVILSISSQCLVRAKAELFKEFPVVTLSDAPWLLWKHAYSKFEGLPLLGRRYAREEARTAKRVSALVYASDWARDWAISEFQVPASLVHSTPLGATFIPPHPIGRSFSRRADQIRLLFIGRDWERKGGPFAVLIAKSLINLGCSARLDIVGCRPTLSKCEESFAVVHGRLNLDAEGDRFKMEHLQSEAHFMVVPSEAECFGIVFSEACALGLPSIARGVHAVPSIVEDGVNGILIRETTSPEEVASRILQCISDVESYRSMSLAARSRFERDLNWEQFGKRLGFILREAFSNHGARLSVLQGDAPSPLPG